MSKHIPVKVDIAHPSDLYKIAALESKVFYNDPVFIIALGDNRAGPTQTQHRADKLDNLARKKGETVKIFKAMLGDEIVGSAVAVTVRNRKGDGDELREEVKEKEEKGGRWGPGADVRFCEDVFTRGDGYMRAACGEEDYAKLNALVVSDGHQRMGIGSQLLDAFLVEADALGLQAVLGASKFGRGLYKKHGFVDYVVEPMVLSQYERGKGMEDEESVIMHRPARPLESEDAPACKGLEE